MKWLLFSFKAYCRAFTNNHTSWEYSVISITKKNPTQNMFNMKFLHLTATFSPLTTRWTFPLDCQHQTVPRPRWAEVCSTSGWSRSMFAFRSNFNHQTAARLSRRWHLSRSKTWIMETKRGSEREREIMKRLVHTIPASRALLLWSVHVSLCLQLWCKSNRCQACCQAQQEPF